MPMPERSAAAFGHVGCTCGLGGTPLGFRLTDLSPRRLAHCMEDSHYVDAIRRETIDHAVRALEYLPHLDALQLRHHPTGIRKPADLKGTPREAVDHLLGIQRRVLRDILVNPTKVTESSLVQ